MLVGRAWGGDAGACELLEIMFPRQGDKRAALAFDGENPETSPGPRA
jgi:hypothetical protein